MENVMILFRWRIVGLSILCSVVLSAASGCTHVAAFDRAKLAHPTMAAGDLAGPGEAHMYSVQEGAAGGGSAAESGCGCN
jgi:Domain of unknown function (DUF4266)